MITPERDTSRAHWQRSEAMVVLSEYSNALFNEASEMISRDCSLHEPILWSSLTDTWTGADTVGDTFKRACEKLIDDPSLAVSPDYPSGHLPESTVNRLADFTYFIEKDKVMKEAAATMVALPINLAQEMEDQAAEQNIDFKVDNLSELANIFRSDWFRDMCDQATLTRNGVWNEFSLQRLRYQTPDQKHTPWFVKFDFSGQRADTQAKFSNLTLSHLKDKLKDVNGSAAIAFTPPRLHSSSSGCPVRHTKAHFSQSPEDQQRLQALGAYFHKSPEELTAPRDKSSIDIGLDCLADLFDQGYKISQRAAFGELALTGQVAF